PAFAGDALDRACRAYDRGRTDTEPVDEFVDLAEKLWPDVSALPEWSALQRRRALGAGRAARDPRFVLASVVRRLIEEGSQVRWNRTGEVGPQRWQQLVAR